MDGNNTGAVRGINTRTDYVMGVNAVALGTDTEASGNSSFAHGVSSRATGALSHAEGLSTEASGLVSHVEGAFTRSPGIAAHTEGAFNTASGVLSHAEGLFTSTNGFEGAHIMGRYGAADTSYSWFLANGTSELAQGLAAKILVTGDAFIDNAWNGGGADYAELYETDSGQPIEPGCFVTFAGASDKIRLAQGYDEYILGVVSKTPGFVAGAGELRWKNKYKTDEWGGIVYEDVTVPEVKDKEGKVVIPARVESRPVTDPSYDPNRSYVPRMNRPEWVKVGLLGAVRVRDDGTLTPGGYCRPGMNGIATAAHTGYRVLKRTGANQALILLK